MIVIYKDNNFEIPNNIDNKVYYDKSGGGGVIYLLKYKNKDIIVKNFDENKKDCFNAEMKNFFYIKDNIKDNYIIKEFIIDYLAFIEYKNNYMIFMNKLYKLLNYHFLKDLKKKEQEYILFQILITIYEMNYKHLIYFNDLYYDNSIKNIMVILNNKPKNLEYIMEDNIKLNYIVNKYQVKIIDYGYITKYPTLHTIKYMKLYFNELLKKNIISEILLFSFFFYLTLYKENKELIINNFNTLINNIFNSNQEDIVIKKFDSFLLQNLYKGIYIK